MPCVASGVNIFDQIRKNWTLQIGNRLKLKTNFNKGIKLGFFDKTKSIFFIFDDLFVEIPFVIKFLT